MRGVRVRRDAGRRGRAPGLPGLQRRRASCAPRCSRGGRFRHACARGRSPSDRDARGRRGPRRPRGARRQYLAWREGDDVRVVPLEREWTRIGRSLAADVRFDDPTVSRRHALIVRQPDGVRVLDDRSLNGVFVNGERVEWRVLDRRRRDRRRALPPALRGRARPRRLPAAGAAARSRRLSRRRRRRAGRSAPSHRPRLPSRAPWPRRSRCSPRRAGRGRRPPSGTSPTCCARSGLSVLAVDLDPQGNLSDYFDVPPEAAADGPRGPPGPGQGPRRRPRRRHPREPVARRGRAVARAARWAAS